MSESFQELPLYPSQLVLFPYSHVQLHVSDPRFQEMILKCMEQDESFGLVLIRSEDDGEISPYLVGTRARIQKAFTHPDGRMDLQVYGEARFRIREMGESEEGYPLGWVENVFDQDPDFDEPDDVEIVDKVRDSFRTLIQRLMPQQNFHVRIVFPENPAELSFTIAGLMPMDNLSKQHLLETTETTQRLRDLLPILSQQLIESRPNTMRKVTTEELSEWLTRN